MRYEEGVCVPLTLLIDRAIDPEKNVRDLKKVGALKLIITENDKIIECIEN